MERIFFCSELICILFKKSILFSEIISEILSEIFDKGIILLKIVVMVFKGFFLVIVCGYLIGVFSVFFKILGRGE